ncbi:DUF1396 domain-containing protein [Streptomyces sp. 2A115]|uniref:DUF1396 domain-containing protein n=1 Tax=Streptomyces sp. 2A115 TaxID=3457439 RepID=UPI003FD2FA31
MMISARGSARHKAASAALAAALLSAGATACASSDGDSPGMTPAAAVAKAAAKTEEITSLHYRMTGKVPGEGRIEAEASMSMKPTISMSMEMTALDQATDNEIEIRLVDKAMYVGGGAAAAKEMDGKSWMKFDLSALGEGALGGESLGAGQADRNPAEESAILTGAKDVEKVGTETVDGVKTTHYKGTITLDEWREQLKDEDKQTRERREKALDQYEDIGIEKLTMDMWVDPDDHTKQFRLRGSADKGPLDMTVTFLDFNKPVTVKAPPAKDTADLADMMGDLDS